LDFYDKIKEDIKATNLNIAEFARRIGVSRDTVYKLGEGTAISTYFKIIEVLGKTPEDYFSKKLESKKTDFEKKYFETLEKLNKANEKLLLLNEASKKATKAKK
jgi:DNA-binding XRE family transcriptional regulator